MSKPKPFKNILSFIKQQDFNLIAKFNNAYHFISKDIDDCTVDLITGKIMSEFRYGSMVVHLHIMLDNICLKYYNQISFGSSHIVFPADIDSEEAFFQYSTIADVYDLEYNDYRILTDMRNKIDSIVKENLND